MNLLDASYQKSLEDLEKNGSLRALQTIDHHGGVLNFQGNQYVNLSSNDYLGLAGDKKLWRNFLKDEISDSDSFQGGSCSSRLLTGNNPEYQKLENRLTELYRREAALVFNSGYHANMGILPALAGKKDLILADKLVHASLIDGMRLSEAKMMRYGHLDLSHLERLLQKHRSEFERIFIVSESIFSMDGDSADLPRLVELKETYQAALYIDEAHSVGVRGKNGLGCCEEDGLIYRIDLIVGTFGKAFASQGAFLISSRSIREYLINTMRTLIFTTAAPAFSLKWSRYVLERMPEFEAKRAHLITICDQLRNGVASLGLETKGASHIIPLLIGENESCVRLARQIRERGFYALPIRPPTVPKGSARIRFSLTADTSADQIDRLLSTIEELNRK